LPRLEPAIARRKNKNYLCYSTNEVSRQEEQSRWFDSVSSYHPIPFLENHLGVKENHDGNGNGKSLNKRFNEKTMAVHVRYNFWYISLPSFAKQQREMTKFCVV